MSMCYLNILLALIFILLYKYNVVPHISHNKHMFAASEKKVLYVCCHAKKNKQRRY